MRKFRGRSRAEGHAFTFLEKRSFLFDTKKIELSKKESLQRYYQVSKIVFTQIYIKEFLKRKFVGLNICFSVRFECVLCVSFGCRCTFHIK